MFNTGFGPMMAKIAGSLRPTQAQVNQQAAAGAGSSMAGDSFARREQRKRSLNAVRGERSRRKVAFGAADALAPRASKAVRCGGS